MSTVISACGHERPLFELESRSKIIKYVTKHLKKHLDEFDAIAISGYSSAMIAPIIADKLKKNIVLVRKSSEVRNSCLDAEGMHNQRCVIIDDLISSGATFTRITSGLADIQCTVVGYVLYNNFCDDFSDEFDYVPCWGSFCASNSEYN